MRYSSGRRCSPHGGCWLTGCGSIGWTRCAGRWRGARSWPMPSRTCWAGVPAGLWCACLRGERRRGTALPGGRCGGRNCGWPVATADDAVNAGTAVGACAGCSGSCGGSGRGRGPAGGRPGWSDHPGGALAAVLCGRHGAELGVAARGFPLRARGLPLTDPLRKTERLPADRAAGRIGSSMAVMTLSTAFTGTVRDEAPDRAGADGRTAGGALAAAASAAAGSGRRAAATGTGRGWRGSVRSSRRVLTALGARLPELGIDPGVGEYALGQSPGRSCCLRRPALFRKWSAGPGRC